MRMVLISVVLMAGMTSWGDVFAPRSAPAAFSREKAMARFSYTNGVYSVCHTGRLDWAVETYATIPVKPGERFAYSADVRRLGKGFVNLSVMLKMEDGSWKWGYGLRRYEKNGSGRQEFLIPPGGKMMTPRITGSGETDAEIAQLKLESLPPIEFPELPTAWRLASDALEIVVSRDGIGFVATDRRTGRRWEPAKDTSFTMPQWRALSAEKRGEDILALTFLDLDSLRQYTAEYKLEQAELLVTIKGEGDCKEPLCFPAPLATAADDYLIFPSSEGFRLPLAEKHPGIWSSGAWGSSFCMPFFGVEAGRNGSGWEVILETADDARMMSFSAKGGRLAAVAPGWQPQHGQFGYPRRARYVFLEKGGYVAMAKRYRAAALREGLVKTFAEKAKERPNVDRLLGAANVWYFQGHKEPSAVAVAKELQAAGLRRFLWSAGHGAETVRAIAALPDVLVGRYDCYRDVYYPEMFAQMAGNRKPPPPENEICSNTSAWPEDIVWNDVADSNSWRKAWGVWDKTGKKKIHCATQCDLKAIGRERRNVARELQAVPYTARFIDVTTAVGWEECANPAHPMTRTQSRVAKCELLALLGREFNLVVGSEQGIGAAVPACDYFEGMLSPGWCRMPHGRPGAGRTDIFRDPAMPTNVTPAEIAKVVKYGVGGKYRIPLFELVYHDCCCAHWYWYDYSNRPLGLWKQRDLINALYGTAPMYIFDYRHWQENKAQFLASYNLVSPIARRTGYSEMVDHRALDAERLVQQTRFADGTIVTVNFGDAPFVLSNGKMLASKGVLQTYGDE